MIGTLFLYMYWPSFNAALGNYGSEQQRAILNTLLAISTSVISACLFSRITKRYLDMIIVVNATLAGGSAMGAAANLINYPFCSMIVGFCAGMVATFGFAFLNDCLKKNLKLHDTQGVHFSHGLPGIMGGLVSVISCALAQHNFGDRYPDFFTTNGGAVQGHRTQASYQLATLGTSLGLAIAGGLLAGFIASLPFFQPPKELFDDRENWCECQPPEIEHEFEHDHCLHTEEDQPDDLHFDHKEGEHEHHAHH